MRMKILLASSEVHPYSKTGGLGDMVSAMGKAMARAGHSAGIVTPLYRGIRREFPGLKKLDLPLSIQLGPKTITGDVWMLEPEENLRIYFIDQPQFFDRPGVYGENGADYGDNAARYIFYSKCVVHLANTLQPDFVHAHDWQAALVPLFLFQQRVEAWQGPSPITLLTIHNLAYQGNFARWDYELTNLPWSYYNPNGVEFYGYMSCLKAGILYADAITTVSPTYAREILTEAFGCGLDGVLRHRQDTLSGILNGVDYDEWNTEHNRFLPHAYSVKDLSGKAANKLDLQKEVGLPANPSVPLFANITRLVDQKGVDILLGALKEMLPGDMQFVLLGSGSVEYANAFSELARQYPEKFAVKIGFSQPLSHRIESGADFYVMPSRFEPCGLNQMYSLRYGAIPIVRATGGMDDSIIDARQDQDKANGIKFTEYSVRALVKAFQKAMVLYHEPAVFEHYRRNAMKTDFSWERTVREYLAIYKSLAKPKPPKS
jgi:starch synthase